MTVFRYEDLPGMIGRVGTIFGAHGINISSAAVGHTPDGADGEDRRLAAMVVTTDARGAAGGRQRDRRLGGIRRRLVGGPRLSDR